MKKAIIHKGPAGCMDIAIYLVREVKDREDQVIYAEDIEYTNGKQAQAGDPIVCCSCGKPLYTICPEGWAK